MRKVRMVMCRVRALSDEIDRLQRYCQCCGHTDGICPKCGRMHSPAVEDGCEVCSAPDEATATYSNGQGVLL